VLIALQVHAPDRDSLRLALAGLTAMNQALMARGRVPSLYQSGVRYRRESPDRWSTADLVNARGFGDCEDLSAWRAAELRQAGEPAYADVRHVGGHQWHAYVVRGDGRSEDPSAALGMRSKRRRRKKG
jgi:hypothetical protein